MNKLENCTVYFHLLFNSVFNTNSNHLNFKSSRKCWFPYKCVGPINKTMNKLDSNSNERN